MAKLQLILPEKALNSVVLSFSERIPFSIGVKQLMDGHAANGRRSIGHLLMAKRMNINIRESNMQAARCSFLKDIDTELLVGRGLDRSDIPDEITGVCKWSLKDHALTDVEVGQMTRLITRMRTDVVSALDRDNQPRK